MHSVLGTARRASRRTSASLAVASVVAGLGWKNDASLGCFMAAMWWRGALIKGCTGGTTMDLLMQRTATLGIPCRSVSKMDASEATRCIINGDHGLRVCRECAR